MADKPTSYQLSIYISGLFIIFFSIFIYWSFRNSQILIHENARLNAARVSTEIIGNIEEKTFVIEELGNNLAMQVPILVRSFDIKEFMTNLVERYSFVPSIQIYLDQKPEGTGPILYVAERIDTTVNFFEDIEIEQFCHACNSVLRPMIGHIPSGWSEAYRCPRDSHLVVLFYKEFSSKTVNGDQGISGYVSFELSLDFLNEMILSTRVGEKGFAFLMDTLGTFITHPIEKFMIDRTLFNLPEQVFNGDPEELYAILRDSSAEIIVYPDILDHAKSLAIQTRIPKPGWILAVVLPYFEIYYPLRWFIFKMIIITFLAVAIIFILIPFISNRVLNPLARVTHEIQSFSADKAEYDGYLRNEAEALANSLKRLRKMYEKFRLNEAESNKQRELIQQDLSQAYEIQKSIIPPPGIWVQKEKGVQIYSVFHPSQVVSGDLYDFFMIDDRYLLITIGDVSGAGVPAALFMGVAHTFIKSYAKGKKAKKIISQVNMELCRNNTNQFFLTLFLGILDTQTGNLNYCNAGHNPSFLIKHEGKVELLENVHGLPLGLHAERTYSESNLKLLSGDKIFFYTDGVTDQTNELGLAYGLPHVRLFLQQNKDKSLSEIGDKLYSELKNYAGSNKNRDDISMLVMQYSGIRVEN